MRVVFMGTPEFAVTPLEYLVLNKFDVVGVYTQPDKAAGRGQTVSVSPVKKKTLELGLPVFQPVKIRTAEEQARLESLKPEIIIVAAFGQILPESTLIMPRFGCVNIHPSLLPKYRGVSPIPAAILNGDDFTGVSIMLMDKGIDTGPILAQATLAISDNDTTGILTEKLSRVSAQLLVEVLPRWIKQEIVPRVQTDEGTSYTRPILKTAGEIDWTRSAIEISRQVRAYQPWPGSFTRRQGKQLKIIEAAPNISPANEPGKVVQQEKSGFGIETGCGVLTVHRVQLEGKKAVAADEFLRGQRPLVGAVLPN